ncbi:MAG: flavodoxin [Mogibacterium sp.]|nr:flavodoxin [Mogibacterium sp.]
MSRTLVAYFSATGITRKLALNFAETLNADIFEIIPEQPYTEKEINWTNPLSRCNKEKIGKKDVPVAGKVENMVDYDTVFIGFPIWYYCAPNVVSTFVKDYDWSGKKVALFATSGGSDVGKSVEKLRPFMPGTPHMAGAKLFDGNASAEEILNWTERIIKWM